MKKIKLFVYFLLAGSFFACAHHSQVQTFTLEKPPSIGTVAEVGNLSLGGFSGLVKLNGDHYLTLTDRGPNGPMIDFKGDGRSVRPFLLPSYRPQIVFFQLKEGKIEVEKQVSIMTTGLPNVPMIDETPSTAKGTPLFHNPMGIDSEGIIVDGIGNFWIVEEYGPSLVKVDPNGQMLNRFLPKTAPFKRTGKKILSAALAKRRPNRGFEGITRIGQKLYLVLQSPIDSKSKLVPIVEFDLRTETQTGLYLYQLDPESDKVGDLTSNSMGEIFVLEQNGKMGTECYRKIYSLTINSQLNVLSKTGMDNFEGEPVPKKMEYDLHLKDIDQEEKIEGIAWIDENTVAVIADNDFGLGFLFDEKTGKIGQMKNNPSKLFIVSKK
ncbi:MAG: hypothetical protein COW00_15680 [Bdellovibrio sp. CG12_big_fil_rev_8_21_14_0_65_39_13]|nr:MAG: hypothetical protein COW78_05545 [Bdellovibrio sp. CG22_combo_CG10-13_8_21_14_all_39_27]PIQ58440.1 MAG: hypothetical protein COW00_15680 [Bdellovibrio sp. CG12_big_fil_rev_8_21_14_0_65_39_13]PIR35393.1 MAG: hypothetical protein COV37_07895 [Bdellovibrio sp. CG11_big_fil_rev_8_21_14_0_20_39_38]PJB52407.1 MAG: hypothetical protein CO099_12855 [Bdellovibrio sp. CG_4_9_14_3_um_filter_39_7]